MTAASVDTVSNALVSARQQRTTTSAAPFASALSTPDEAYAVQAAVAARMGWFASGAPQYWKSGGPSRQAVLTHAPLPPQGVWNSPAAAGDFVFSRRGIEAEIALRLATDVDPVRAAALTETDAAALIDAMAVSIEVVDSRWTEGMEAPAILRLADLQAHGALVLGEWQPWSARDWSEQTCRVSVGHQAVVERRGTHPLGDPAWGLVTWLRHATRQGATVAAGTVVTTGTWVGILDAQKGDRVVAEFEDVGHAEVQL